MTDNFTNAEDNNHTSNCNSDEGDLHNFDVSAREIKYLRTEILHLRQEILSLKNNNDTLNIDFQTFKKEQMNICAEIKLNTQEIITKINSLIVPDKENNVLDDANDECTKWNFPLQTMDEIRNFDSMLYKNNQLKYDVVSVFINYE